MRERGIAYIAWSDSRPVSSQHDEILEAGRALEIRVRASVTGATQLFIGVYHREGNPVAEEYYPCLIGKTLDHALALGITRGRSLAVGAADSSFSATGVIVSPQAAKPELPCGALS